MTRTWDKGSLGDSWFPVAVWCWAMVARLTKCHELDEGPLRLTKQTQFYPYAACQSIHVEDVQYAEGCAPHPL
jgi:hypothetical protein